MLNENELDFQDYSAHCDASGCDQKISVGTDLGLDGIKKILKSSGWKIRKHNGVYRSYCPKCSEKEK